MWSSASTGMTWSRNGPPRGSPCRNRRCRSPPKTLLLTSTPGRRTRATLSSTAMSLRPSGRSRSSLIVGVGVQHLAGRLRSWEFGHLVDDDLEKGLHGEVICSARVARSTACLSACRGGCRRRTFGRMCALVAHGERRRGGLAGRLDGDVGGRVADAQHDDGAALEDVRGPVVVDALSSSRRTPPGIWAPGGGVVQCGVGRQECRRRGWGRCRCAGASRSRSRRPRPRPRPPRCGRRSCSGKPSSA